MLTKQQQSVFNTINKIYELTKDGTNDSFCTIFGKAKGDGNVWNAVRRDGTVKRVTGFKYFWTAGPPDEVLVKEVHAECKKYVSQRKDSKSSIQSNLAFIEFQADTILSLIESKIVSMRSIAVVAASIRDTAREIRKSIIRSPRVPNPDYVGIGDTGYKK